MTPERWSKVKAVVAEALEFSVADKRRQFLEDTCGADRELREEVESLLAQTPRGLEEAADSVTALFAREFCPRFFGERLGAYEIVRALGRGGMGAVYLARRADGQFEREVAVKVLKRGTDTEEILRRFEAERRIVARLDHPRIARLWDAGTTADGLPYFVIEYVSGTPITQFANDRDLSLKDRLTLFLKVCAAVQYAHEHSVIHRDLKPTNILVTEEGEPKLLDFGIAKIIDDSGQDSDYTVTQHVRFTPNYASPEQAHGGAVTQASDVYALGALLYELVTGKTPHRFSSPHPTFEEVARVLRDDVPELPSRAAEEVEQQSELRGNLDRIILHSLQPDPTQRYAKVKDFAADIQSYLEAKPVRAPRLTNRYVWTALAACLVLGALIVFKSRLTSTPPRPPASSSIATAHSLAILPFQSLAQDEENKALGLGMADAIIGRMSGLKKLAVLPTSAVSRWKNSTADAIAVGRSLNVDAILCGTVQRSDNRIRVSVQLANVTTRQTLWAATFDQTFADVFALQDTISRSVARSLAANLSPEDQKQLARHDTDNTAAYNYYLLGLSSYNERTNQGLATAIGYFQKAIAEDANYALAYALMSDCYFLRGYYKYDPPEASNVKAQAAAEQAVRIDSSLAEGYLALSNILLTRPPASASQKLLLRALALNPNLAVAHQRRAWQLCAAGELEQSIVEMKRAQQLDPLSATNATALGVLLLVARQFEAGLFYCEKAAELNPNEFNIQSNLGFAYLHNRRFDEAIARFQKATDIYPASEGDNLAAISLTLWKAGKLREATEMLPKIVQLAESGKVDPYNLALVYNARGEKDEAFKWLTRSFEKGGPVVPLIRYDPLLDGLREDNRFREIIHRYYRQPAGAK